MSRVNGALHREAARGATRRWKPRILFLTQTHCIWGGMESWLHKFTLWLQGRDWDVRVGLAKGSQFNDPQAYLATHPHMASIIMDAAVGTETARVQAIVDACRGFSPDLVLPIALGSVFPAIRRLKSSDARVRLVVPVRSLHPDFLQNVIDEIGYIDEIVGVSRLIEKFFLRALPHEAERIHYVRHGVAKPIVRHCQIDGPLRLGYVGRLDNSSKRILDLIPLADHLQKAGSPCTIDIFGDGEDGSTLRKHFARSALQVTFHGFLTNVELYRKAYPNLDVLLLFSPTEGSPFSLYEAMQHGVLPVVARFQGHASEGLLRHGANAFTFSIGDVRGAAAHVDCLAKRRDLLEEMSSRAKYDVEGWVETRMHEDWETILESSLERQPRFSCNARERETRQAGRLERFGLPPKIANRLRQVLGRKWPHQTGFEEWPGSQPVSCEDVERIKDELRGIENEAVAGLYGETETDGHATALSVPSRRKVLFSMK